MTDATAAPPRERVLRAAARLFVEHGYAQTSIGAIAGEAGVAVQTIYSGYGSKVGLLTAVQDRLVAGDGTPVPQLERAWARALEPSRPDHGLRTAVGELAEATARVAPLAAVIAAASSDPAVARLLDELHRQRIESCRTVADRVLGDAVPVARRSELGDSLYVLLGPECHDLLVLRRGWSVERWASWAYARVALDPGTG